MKRLRSFAPSAFFARSVFALLCFAGAAWGQSCPAGYTATNGICVANSSGGGTSVIACASTPGPGNTTGTYRQQCQDGNGAIFACNNSGGCTTSGNWVAVGGSGPPYNEGAIYAIDGGGATTSPTIVLTNGANQTLTLSGNTTVAFTQPSGYVGRVTLYFKQAAGAGDTVTWTLVKWPGGIAPVMTATASAIDIYSCRLDGTYTYCTTGQNFQ